MREGSVEPPSRRDAKERRADPVPHAVLEATASLGGLAVWRFTVVALSASRLPEVPYAITWYEDRAGRTANRDPHDGHGNTIAPAVAQLLMSPRRKCHGLSPRPPEAHAVPPATSAERPPRRAFGAAPPPTASCRGMHGR